MQPKIFVSYAHDDTKWLKLLDPHLAGLKRHAEPALGLREVFARVGVPTQELLVALVVGVARLRRHRFDLARRRRRIGASRRRVANCLPDDVETHGFEFRPAAWQAPAEPQQAIEILGRL